MDFGKGLNILTGETGAGKSILIGSINVALGMQSFKGFAREGADTALVELVFSVEDDALRRKIEALELSVEDGQVILSRRLSGTRSISKVNGETVPLSVVRELASLLIDIHGQHEHQSLLYKKNHLRILDEFAREELGAYTEKNAELYAQYAALKKQMESSVLDEAARKKEADFLQFEVEEIENAGLRAGEDEEVEAQYRKMANARRIAEDAAEAYRLTCDGPGNAGDSVSGALARLLYVSGYDREVEELAGQLSEIESLLSDFNRSLSSYLDDLTFDEGEFAQLESRLDEINRLKAKYGSTIEEILAYKEEKEQRLQELADYDTYLANLEKQYRQSEKRLRENSEKMSEIRSRYAKQLSQMIQAELIDLNFLETNFETEVSQTGTLSAEGMDEVCFLISMNPGSPLRPLGDVASGGELSRIMLAIKTVLAEKDDMPSLIFDEIDVGISGRTAQKVSEKMAVIAANH